MASALRKAARAVTSPGLRRAVSRTIHRARSFAGSRDAFVQLAVRAWWSRTFTGRKPNLYQLEFHVADQCNLNCKGCGHFSPLADGELPSVETFEGDLARLAQLFGTIDELWLLGGEPLLHPRFPDFVRASRVAFPHSRIGVVSNGLLVSRQDDSFWKLLARERVHLRLSGYPVKVDYEALLAQAASHGVSADLTPWRDEFYKMPLHADGKLNPTRMLAECRQHFDCPYLENGSIYHCARIPQSRYVGQAFDLDLADGRAHGLDLAGARDGWDVLLYLRRPNSWCRYCDAEHTDRFAWGPSKRDADEWVETAPHEGQLP